MAILNEMRSATRHRVCPHCGGGLRIVYYPGGGGWILRCSEGHDMADPNECPRSSTMIALEQEARLATAHLRVGQESVAKSMTDLYGG